MILIQVAHYPLLQDFFAVAKPSTAHDHPFACATDRPMPIKLGLSTDMIIILHTMRKYSACARWILSPNLQTIPFWLNVILQVEVRIILIIFALLIFLLGTYSLVVSKLLPSTGIWLLDCIREDMYFCLLVPMLIPVTLMKVYCSWVSMKFFKHA
mmetsp:Transcript_6742/g.12800  ORF Transcript_6742/g.12800 Transcript_6742/m.12800 type:complete len:155 (-) Transcript_6742:279-743(-)